MEETIRKIIEAGISAPSGENCQPWRFEVKGSQIYIFNLPARDDSLYSWGQRASFVAHGALIENMRIAASALGYTQKITFFPMKENPNLFAVIELDQSNPQNDPLFTCIRLRCTNRKPYKKAPLTQEQKADLIRSSQEVGRGRVILTDGPENVATLARIASTNEEILFENPHLHSFFFGHINWTKREDSEKSIGFYLKTLELPPPATILFKLFKHWPLTNAFNKVGFSKFIAKQNSKIYASSGAFGVVAVNGIAPEDFLTAGRVMQRVWLKVTKMGLSLQPLTGILFLMLRVESGDISKLSPRHVELVKSAYEKIKAIFGVNSERVVMMFRVGDGGSPSAKSSRLPPEIVIKA